MFLHKPTSRWPTKPSRETFGSICSFEFNAKGSQDIDSPSCSRTSVLLILRHGSGDFRINEPMAAFDIVIITTRTHSLDYERLDILDGRELSHRLRRRRSHDVKTVELTRSAKSKGERGLNGCLEDAQTYRLRHAKHTLATTIYLSTPSGQSRPAGGQWSFVTTYSGYLEATFPDVDKGENK